MAAEQLRCSLIDDLSVTDDTASDCILEILLRLLLDVTDQVLVVDDGAHSASKSIQVSQSFV